MTIKEQVEAELARPEVGPITKTIYRQLVGFDEVERTAKELGYEFGFNLRVPIVEIWRNVDDIRDKFAVLPQRPNWLEEGEWIETQGGLLMKLVDNATADVMDVLDEQNEGELRLHTYYTRRERNVEKETWSGYLTSVQALTDLLRNPPKVE